MSRVGEELIEAFEEMAADLRSERRAEGYEISTGANTKECVQPLRPHVPTFPLRLPTSLRTAVDRLAQTENMSVNQFIAMAVAEKISALATANELERRAASVDLKVFDQIMNRNTPEPDLEADHLDNDRA